MLYTETMVCCVAVNSLEMLVTFILQPARIMLKSVQPVHAWIGYFFTVSNFNF